MTSHEVDDQDGIDKGISLGSLHPLDWQLLRLAFVLHCIPICGKLARAGWHGATWCWQKISQMRTNTICLEANEGTSITHLTLGADWSSVLEREQLVVAQSLARLQALQSELASLQSGQFALNDID